MAPNKLFWMFILLLATLAINVMGMMKISASLNVVHWHNEFANVVNIYKSLIHEPIRGALLALYPRSWWRPPDLFFDYLIVVSMLTLAVTAADFGNAPAPENPLEYAFRGAYKWSIMVFMSPIVLFVGAKAWAKDPATLTREDRFFRRVLAIFGLLIVMFMVVALANYHYAQVRRF